MQAFNLGKRRLSSGDLSSFSRKPSTCTHGGYRHCQFAIVGREVWCTYNPCSVLSLNTQVTGAPLCPSQPAFAPLPHKDQVPSCVASQSGTLRVQWIIIHPSIIHPTPDTLQHKPEGPAASINSRETVSRQVATISRLPAAAPSAPAQPPAKRCPLLSPHSAPGAAPPDSQATPARTRPTGENPSFAGNVLHVLICRFSLSSFLEFPIFHPDLFAESTIDQRFQSLRAG